MINNHYPNIKQLIINVLSSSSTFDTINECRKKFIINVLICFSAIKGKINFLQMQRFSQKCEQYFRINFENKFNYQAFNLAMIKQNISECVIAFDPSYIPKSGKKTYGLGSYWSGCAGAVKRGLEICGFAAVDIKRNIAFHLDAIQTPKSKDFNLLHYYCQIIKENELSFKELSTCLVADSFFAKSEVVKTITDLNMHFISRLRDDAVLFYLNQAPRTGKKGAPKKYTGRVNSAQPDENYFQLVYHTSEIKVFNAIVYCKAFKRNINLAITLFYDETGRERARKLYFSTDLTMEGMKVVTAYRSRFQIEFLYRDAKQHCGLEDCQARSENKLYSHFNAALTTVNIAKVYWLQNEKSDHIPFSMANYKTMCNNMLLLNQFFIMFAINPYTTKNQSKIKQLLNYGIIAA